MSEDAPVYDIAIISRLESTGLHWLIGKGRTRANEPLYGVAMFEILPDGLTNQEAIVKAEHHSLRRAVENALLQLPDKPGRVDVNGHGGRAS